MKLKLTPEICAETPPPASGRLEIRDEVEPGLVFRITAAGSRSWSCRYLAGDGSQPRQTWAYPDIGLVQARRQARALKGGVVVKKPSASISKAAKAEAERLRLDRFDTLAEDYFADAAVGLHRVRGKPKKPKELLREKQLWERHIAKTLGHRAVSSITRREIVDFIGKQTRIAGSRGRKSNALISQLFGYAVMKDIVQANIATNIPVIIPGARLRMMTDQDMRTVWNALDGALSRQMALAIRFMAVTLQRSGQVLAMKWADVDFEKATWTCPPEDMKKERPHLVPLSGLALGILREAAEHVGGETFVFASPRAKGPMRVDAASQGFRRLTARLGVEDAILHDFRRTGTTAMTARLGITEFIAGRVLSHGSDSRNITARHYNMHDYLAEKRRALDAWASLLDEIVTGKKQPDNVVKLAG